MLKMKKKILKNVSIDIAFEIIQQKYLNLKTVYDRIDCTLRTSSLVFFYLWVC